VGCVFFVVFLLLFSYFVDWLILFCVVFLSLVSFETSFTFVDNNVIKLLLLNLIQALLNLIHSYDSYQKKKIVKCE